MRQLCGAFTGAEIGSAFEAATLSYAQFKLHVRALGDVFLVAVLAAEVNLPALKMATQLLSHQLSDWAHGLGALPPSAAEQPAARSYRGRRLPG